MLDFLRRTIRNTWLHRLPITTMIYTRLAKRRNHLTGNPIDFRGLVLTVDLNDITIVPGLIAGDYEVFELEVFEKLLIKGSVVLDVGANIGIYSLVAARIVDSTGSVTALEPTKDNLSMLRTNLKANNATRVAVVSKAAGAKKEELAIYKQANSMGTHSISRKGGDIEMIDVVTIDSLRLKPTVMKIDVEGYEVLVLKGAKNSLKSVEYLLIEYAPALLKASGHTLSDMTTILKREFTTFYEFNEKLNKLIEINVDDLKAVNNTNILACRKGVSKPLIKQTVKL